MSEVTFPKVRRARETDAEEIVSWFPDRGSVVSWGSPHVPDPLDADWLAREFFAPGREHYVLTDVDDEPVGIFGIRFHARERRAHLIRVALSPEWRGLGLSGLLLKGATTLAREARALRLTLNVYGSNDVARQAYERAGFFPYEFAQAPEDSTGTMIRMLKPLG